MHSRRELGALLCAAAAAALTASKAAWGRASRNRQLIMAPSNLGLRPLRPGHVPGAWRAPEALASEGLAAAVGASRTVWLDRPVYRSEAPAGSRIRNGPELRRFSERLSIEVGAVLAGKGFPIVVGGDCSILLGCLAGARCRGTVGLLHVDGHSDFYHPGNYDPASRLGTAAGMDLALATGRGEPLLASWDGSALVEDRHVSQIGERDELQPDYDYHDIASTRIRRFPIRRVRKSGLHSAVREALAPVDGLRPPLWLHIDLDVLDGKVMPAVDSPGSPGLRFDELAELIQLCLASNRIVGLDVAIYDPDLDPTRHHARRIVDCLRKAFA